MNALPGKMENVKRNHHRIVRLMLTHYALRFTPPIHGH